MLAKYVNCRFVRRFIHGFRSHRTLANSTISTTLIVFTVRTNRMPRFAIKFVATFVSLVALTSAQSVSSELYSGLQWRLIGPFRGGRVVAVAGIPGNSTTFYFGSVGGGVWQTTDAGVVWKPIFDGQPIASIGALAAAPSDPKVIYAGTGESDIRSNLSSGDGVYKSTDGGRTWANIGLRDSRQISRIVVDPQNANVVYRRRFRIRIRAERRARRLQVNRWRRQLDEGSRSRCRHRNFRSRNCHLLTLRLYSRPRGEAIVHRGVHTPHSTAPAAAFSARRTAVKHGLA